MIAAAISRGVSFPETLRVHLETKPRAFEGIWERPGYSIEFHFGESETISKIDIELRGNTTNFDVMEKQLEEHQRWLVTYP
jgi:hypothetical protein